MHTSHVTQLTDHMLKELLAKVRKVARRAEEGVPCDSWLNFRAPSRAPNRILYVTKPQGLLGLNLETDIAFNRIAIFAHYGIVTATHAALIACEATRHKLSVHFVGDLDPWDLTVFLTLTVELRKYGIDAAYAGIGAEWLQSCRSRLRRPFRLTDALIELAPFELRLLKLLWEAPVDWNRIIGPAGVEILCSRAKLELEGATNPGLYTRAHIREVQQILMG
jgi:hypothetical protein